ncbi:c-type cytochrome [Bacillus sp. FJAT-29790]|uniref:c-type cytochrome n=1 Tax=Bacillus sp. FJAT-29790 TaxID=1895002 RepID=UPI0020B41F2B|nr:hypothetical protein [Bacillus sp. FJAT-29790]
MFIIILSFLAACNTNGKQMETKDAQGNKQEENIGFKPPDMESIKDKTDQFSKSVKQGYGLMNNTHVLLNDYVGNQLSCSSCHGDAGLDLSSSFVGVSAVYPQYNARGGGRVVTIEDRINGCMRRSLNGKPLPINSDEMRAMVSYLSYISKDVPTRI